MAQKTVQIDGIGEVLLQRRRGTKHFRLSVRANGSLRVGMPVWAPYPAAIAFVQSQKDWIDQNRTQTTAPLITPDMFIGKTHHMVFAESDSAARTTTRIVGSEVRVMHPPGMLYRDPSVQTAAERAAVRALTIQAKRLLPKRLDDLAKQHGFTYQSVTIKRLRSRWGSCTTHKDITLNCHLMQLPWDLIDYVLLHELTHTRIMRHGEPFWNELARYVPSLPDKRKAMRTYSPSVVSQ